MDQYDSFSVPQLLLACLHFQPTTALPLSTPFNATAETVGWVSGPSYRSTLSIITSCILTMGICVWSALHLNIPPKDETFVQFWLRSSRWILLGIFGPELVVFAAWRQHVSARALKNLRNLDERDLAAQNSKQEQTVKSGGASDNNIVNDAEADTDDKWTIVHGFYAAMGGFVFELDADTAESLCLPGTAPYRLTISSSGLKMLAECGLLPEIREEDIRDKSKTDGLAKAIVCLQAGWMAVETLSRIVFSLPVTLLEVNTIGHVVCAVFIYLLWWHKPRLIKEPTFVRGPWVRHIATFMWMSSRMSELGVVQGRSPFRPREPSEMSQLVFLPDLDSVSVLDPSGARGTPTKDSNFPCRANYVSRAGVGRLGLRHPGHQTTDCSKREEASHKFRGGLETAMRRWEWALEAAESLPTIRRRLEDGERDGLEQLSDVLLEDSAGDWPSSGLVRTYRWNMMGITLWLASIAYGAVHTAAWHDYFPSVLEAWLWRASSIDIMGSGMVWVAINFLAEMFPPVDRFWDRALAGRVSALSYFILGSLCFVCGVAYVSARIFLVVEACISLRRLPPSAYLSPDWSLLIPHL